VLFVRLDRVKGVRGRFCLSQESPTIFFKVLWSQSQQAPATGADRPLMEPLAPTVEYYVPCLPHSIGGSRRVINPTNTSAGASDT
jgi:hypothetical protein